MAYKNKNDEDDVFEENTSSELVYDYTALIKETAFVGEYPFETILEGIKEQFEDYINIEDDEDYVEIFYRQLHESYKYADAVDEEHPTEIREVLDDIHERFIKFMSEMFNTKFTLSVPEFEDGSYDEDDEFIVKLLYNYFVLKANNNFKVVLTKLVIEKLESGIIDDKEFHDKVNSIMEEFYALIPIDVDRFLELTKAEEIKELYDNGDVSGNFLRKYSPKLYQNEEFLVSTISYITTVYDLQEGIKNRR